MHYQYLEAELADHVMLLTLSRPPVNAVNQAMYAEIKAFFGELNKDEDVHVVVLTGAGKVFCGGNDLDEFATMDPSNADERMRLVREAFFSIYDCAVPVIGAVNGAAVGTGLAIASMCDMLVASTRATFTLPEINVGVLGGGAFGARLGGELFMRRMFFTGEPVGAEELHRVGAVMSVHEPDELLGAAMAVAEKVAEKPARSVRLAKFGLNLREFMPMKEGYALEQSFTARLSGYPESKRSLREQTQRYSSGRQGATRGEEGRS